MTMRPAGVMSMRQNVSGAMPSAATIAARITAGCVTATVRDGLAVNDSSHRDTREIRSAIDSPPCGAAVSRLSHTSRSRGGTAASAWPRHRPQSRSAKRGSVSCLQAKQFRGLPGAPLGSGQLTRHGTGEAVRRFDLATADRVQRFVGGKPPVHHGIRHAVRDQDQPGDLGHAPMLDACCVRAASRRPLIAAKTRPMPAHSTSWVASDSSRNS